MKHAPDLLLTQIANVRYDPGKSCERWEKFVDEVMEGNQEKVRYLQKLFGICLTGDTRLEKMWFLFGSTTRNGKSTMIETISNLLGTYAVSVRATEFQFTPCIKLVCNTNYLPIVSDTTIFKSDRVQVISFDRHFTESEQDKTLKNKLSTGNVLSGILNWCISGRTATANLLIR